MERGVELAAGGEALADAKLGNTQRILRPGGGSVIVNPKEALGVRDTGLAELAPEVGRERGDAFECLVRGEQARRVDPRIQIKQSEGVAGSSGVMLSLCSVAAVS